MKAASGFLSAASAVALSAALAMPSAFVLQLASVSVAQAATVSSIDVRGNQRVDADFGFSAKTISPAILFGKVSGEVISDHGAAYIKGSDRHFSLRLDDAQFDRVMAVVDRWRKLAQPSYDLNRQNCVHFVATIAEAIGMKADTTRLMKKPRSFLAALTEANRSWLAARSAQLPGSRGQSVRAARP